MLKHRHHYYLTPDGAIIRIRSKYRPRPSKTKTGTWTVYEQYIYNGDEIRWAMSSCPEVTFKQLQKLQYIGRTEIPIKQSEE